jgi:signal transduction histidine kinase
MSRSCRRGAGGHIGREDDVGGSSARPIQRGAARSYDRVVKRLALAVTRLPAWVQDLALALALTVANVATLLFYRAQLHPFWLALTLVVLETLPLALRRRGPAATFVAAGLPRTIYDSLGLGFAPLPLAQAIAYFTVIERSRPAVRRILTVVLVLGILRSQFLLPGHSQPYDFTVVSLIFITAGMAGVLSRTRQAYLAEVEARAAVAEAQRDRATAAAAAAERTRIARELHDVVAHHVSLMAVQAEAAGALLPDRPVAAARSVEVIGATARAALTELRRLLGVLRGPAPDPETSPPVSLAGLGTVLDQVRQAGLVVELTVTGPAAELSPGTDLTAYRIVQEALTNSLRHAQATRAEVTLDYEPGFVTVRVTDDGPGATVASAAAPNGDGGFGLAGIAERVASCGGSLTVGPAGRGFAVTARLPAS